ncbi:acyltransferase [Flaviaesturariibacter flavus]|uniref:Acyltransferase n=2 Tax=Flaviaesturariibacter flavus TaxID=2502780 RepID=A0A4V6NB43_9BACT|nr:acyltransferase [Flaviaesturariibacter flavus]
MGDLSQQTIAGNPARHGSEPRVDWVDFAKGFCIFMVVMLHSTAEIEEAVGREGFMRYLVTFAKPFRMPDFFMISGLFLSRVIHRGWRSYLDRKVLHFAYFYFIWVSIHFALKLPGYVRSHELAAGISDYCKAFIQPLGTLWFIYQLPVFFVFIKLVWRIPPPVIFAFGAALEIAHINTGWIVIDQFASRFVYFYTGYWLAPKIFALASWAQSRTSLAALALSVWFLLNGALAFGGYAAKPFISLPLGFAGAAAVVIVAVLLARTAATRPIRYCGQNSIVVYLAFFLPMHATKAILLKTGLVPDVGMMAMITSVAAVSGALLLWWSVRRTQLSFLFVRPSRFRLERGSADRKPPHVFKWSLLTNNIYRRMTRSKKPEKIA